MWLFAKINSKSKEIKSWEIGMVLATVLNVAVVDERGFGCAGGILFSCTESFEQLS